VKKIVSFAYFFFCGSMLCSVTAMAYIDPSAMTYMIQLIAGIAIAAGAGAGFYFRKLKRKFSRRGGDRGRAAVQSCDDDDDDTGYGDYELDASSQPPQGPAAQPEEAGARFAAPSAPAYAYADGPAPAADPFDEAGGEEGLAVENRELRRLLAEERRKVEELKRALHICTAPKR